MAGVAVGDGSGVSVGMGCGVSVGRGPGVSVGEGSEGIVVEGARGSVARGAGVSVSPPAPGAGDPVALHEAATTTKRKVAITKAGGFFLVLGVFLIRLPLTGSRIGGMSVDFWPLHSDFPERVLSDDLAVREFQQIDASYFNAFASQRCAGERPF